MRARRESGMTSQTPPTMYSSPAVRDLTGQCRTTEPHYFVSGGQADIWKGEWMNDKGTVKVCNLVLTCFDISHCLIFVSTQVILKVVRGGWTEPKNLERLKQVRPQFIV